MGSKAPTCPKCTCKLVWNGSHMCCISCSYTEQAKAKSEKKIPTPRKSK